MISIDRKKVIPAIVFAVSAVGMVLVVLSVITTGSSHVEHTSLKIILGQTPDFSLSLKEIGIEDVYPGDYKLNIPNNYYNIKIMSKGKILYTGKVNKKIIKIWDVFESDGERLIFESKRNNFLEEIPSEIKLYLPFYKNAENVLIYDENETLKLSIYLKSFTLTLPKAGVNLCGNGICDTDENIFTCHRDCKNSLKWSWNTISNSFLP